VSAHEHAWLDVLDRSTWPVDPVPGQGPLYLPPAGVLAFIADMQRPAFGWTAVARMCHECGHLVLGFDPPPVRP
jgi:hypothetical protein